MPRRSCDRLGGVVLLCGDNETGHALRSPSALSLSNRKSPIARIQSENGERRQPARPISPVKLVSSFQLDGGRSDSINREL